MTRLNVFILLTLTAMTVAAAPVLADTAVIKRTATERIASDINGILEPVILSATR